MFLDFFEIAFIVIPLLAPVADKMGIDLVWFGVILAMNLQTSFLTPPFGFALFYLRSVAPRADYRDRITQANIPAVTTGQIYRGSIAFVFIQVVMVAMVIAFPQLVTGGITQGTKLNESEILEQMRAPDNDPFAPAPESNSSPTPEANPLAPSANDPLAPPTPEPAGGAAADADQKALDELFKQPPEKK
jgi:hypothetical protein